MNITASSALDEVQKTVVIGISQFLVANDEVIIKFNVMNLSSTTTSTFDILKMWSQKEMCKDQWHNCATHSHTSTL